MKTLGAGFQTHVDHTCTTVAYGLKITRGDGDVFGFTSHDVNDTVDSVLYEANPGMDVTSIVTAAGYSVGNMEMKTLNDEEIFSLVDVMNGVWDNAEFILFRYNYEDTTAGEYLLAGTLGELKVRNLEIVSELRDLRQYFSHPVGAVTSKTCRNRLGLNNSLSSRCPVRLDPQAWQAATPYDVRQTGDAGTGSVVKHASVGNRHFKCTTAGTSGASAPAWNTTIGGTTNDNTVVWTTIQALTVTGTLTSATSNQIFRDNTRTEDADFFAEGEFTWLTGNNAGSSQKVKAYAADGTFTLQIPMYGTVQVGDTYSVYAGCRKRREDCRDKFDNILNMAAEPDSPTLDELTAPGVVDV